MLSYRWFLNDNFYKLALTGAFFLTLFFAFNFFFANTCFGAFSFSITDTQPMTILSKEQEVNVTLNIQGLPSESYFRVAWKKGNDSGSYFGYVKNNNGNWEKIESLSSENCSKYFKVSQTGDSQVNVTIKIGAEENLEQGNYLLRAHRFTPGCSETASTNTSQIQLQLANSSSTDNPSASAGSSPTPASSLQATYKINEVKDKDKNILNSVKIYVDGGYTHHYAPETLSFCDGCKCDTEINCSLGQHTIKLEKSGYQDWLETKIINAGDSYEINPEMTPVEDLSPSSQPSTFSTSKLASPTPSPKSSAKASTTGLQLKLPTSASIAASQASSFSGIVLAGEVLSTQSAGSSLAPGDSNKSGKFSTFIIPITLSILGLVLMGISLVPFLNKFIPR